MQPRYKRFSIKHMLSRRDFMLIGKIVDEKIGKQLSVFSKQVVELFTVTNQRIDRVEENLSKRIDKVVVKLDEYTTYLNDHERRIEKLEEKVIVS